MQAGLGDSGRAGAVCPRIYEQHCMHVNQYMYVHQRVVRYCTCTCASTPEQRHKPVCACTVCVHVSGMCPLGACAFLVCVL